MIKLKKRMITMLLAFVMVFSCIPQLPARAEDYKNIYAGEILDVVAPNGVKMHLVPSTEGKVLTVMTRGSTLCVLSVNTVTGWLRVMGQTGGKTYTGYMYAGADGWYTQHANAEQPTFKYTNKKAIVQANILNVHSAPNQQPNSIIGVLGYGNEVNALGYTATGWTKIEYKGQSAFVSSEWVKIVPCSEPIPEPKTETFYDICGYSAKIKNNYNAVNIHRSWSTSSAVIDDLYSGQVVTILAQSDNWYRVTINVEGVMETGYILRSYCNKIDALNNITLSAAAKSLKVGKKYHILVRGTTGMDYEVSFKSKNKKIAKVSKTGYVTAKKQGTTKIICTVKVTAGSEQRTKKLTCNVTVKNKKATAVG